MHISEVKYTCTKTCQSSQWHIKCTFMPLNVLSTPIPFGIRNGIIYGPLVSNTQQQITFLALLPSVQEWELIKFPGNFTWKLQYSYFVLQKTNKITLFVHLKFSKSGLYNHVKL